MEVLVAGNDCGKVTDLYHERWRDDRQKIWKSWERRETEGRDAEIPCEASLCSPDFALEFILGWLLHCGLCCFAVFFPKTNLDCASLTQVTHTQKKTWWCLFFHRGWKMQAFL